MCVCVCVCVCVCNCVCKVNLTVRQTIHIAIGGEIHIYTYRCTCEKDKESLRIKEALSLKMINLTYILIYEHVFAWYCVEKYLYTVPETKIFKPINGT